MLFEMAQSALGTDDEGTLSILTQRLADAQPDETFMDALMDVEEAQQVIDQNDVQECNTAKAKLVTSKRAYASLSHDYIRHKKKVMAAKPEAEGAKPKAEAKPKFKNLPESARIPQAEAKSYLPPSRKDLARSRQCFLVRKGATSQACVPHLEETWT